MTLSAAGPLIAAVGGSQRATAARRGCWRSRWRCVELLLAGPLGLQDGVRLLTVVVVSALAVVLAALRGRLEQATAEARSALAHRRGDARAARRDLRPRAGRARLPRPRRPLRAHQRPPGGDQRAHAGRARRPHDRRDAARRARGGRRGRGAWPRAACPSPRWRCAARRRRTRASQREWIASVLAGARGGSAATLLGVGTVVFEVTDRRAAERALRTQTDRYETLLAALSEVGEGMVVIEDDRCVYANHAFEQLSGYTFPELAALESLYEIVERRRALGGRAARPAAHGAGSRRHDLHGADPAPRRRPADARAGRRAARDRGPARAAPARRRRARRHRAPARRGRARAAARPLRAAGGGERAVRPVARRGAHAAQRRRAVRARPRRHLRGRARRLSGTGAAADRGRPRPGARAALAADGGARRPHRRRRRGGHAQRRPVRPRAARRGAAAAPAAACSGRSPPASTRSSRTAATRRSRCSRTSGGARRSRSTTRACTRSTSAVATHAAALAAPAGPAAHPGRRSSPRATAPSGEGIELGGDFYDCFATGAGDWALVIGDVCGKGAEAAAITALARYTLRASVAALAAPVAGARRAQRGAAAPGSRLPLLHRRSTPR